MVSTIVISNIVALYTVLQKLYIVEPNIYVYVLQCHTSNNVHCIYIYIYIYYDPNIFKYILYIYV